jgi:hypothetical protein
MEEYYQSEYQTEYMEWCLRNQSFVQSDLNKGSIAQAEGYPLEDWEVSLDDFGTVVEFARCRSCGWHTEEMTSHIIQGNTFCPVINRDYDIWFDSDGEVEFTKKVKKQESKKKAKKTLMKASNHPL